MARHTEELVSEAVRSTLARYQVSVAVDTDDLGEVLVALEYFVPEVLREHFRDWRKHGLDGVVAVKGYVSGERELEILGIGTVMSELDYFDVPLYVRLSVPPEGSVLEGMDVRIGVAQEGGMVRESDSKVWKRAYLMEASVDTTDWAYRATRPRSTDLAP